MNKITYSDPTPVARTGRAERDYLLSRAAAHSHLAEKAQQIDVRAVHSLLEKLYEERAKMIDLVQDD